MTSLRRRNLVNHVTELMLYLYPRHLVDHVIDRFHCHLFEVFLLVLLELLFLLFAKPAIDSILFNLKKG